MPSISDTFQSKSSSQLGQQDTIEMQEWMAAAEKSKEAGAKPLSESFVPLKPESAEPGKPMRRKTDDILGRVSAEVKSTAGTVMRNVAEVPGSALRGVHDALANATAFVNPLEDWLNENVADLHYDLNDTAMHDPKTGTGNFVKETAKFLTGFIPATKALKAAGAGTASASVMGGAIADFATRSGNESRMSDLWKQFGLPSNVLTDYLSSNKNDSELEGRFKNAIEGLGLGGLTEGLFMAARALRGAKAVPGALKEEQLYLKGKYGEVTDEHIMGTGLGDTSKPVVQIGTPVAPAIDPAVAPKLDPRALIRGKPRKVAEEPLAGYKTTELGDVIVNESAKEPGKFQVTYFDGKFEKGAVPTQDHVFNTREEAIKAFEDAGDGVVHEQSWGKPSAPAVRPEDFDVYVNFSKFDSQDDVKFAIGKMAEASKGSIDEATRGKIAQVETAKMAEDLGMTVEDLLSRRKGQGFNAEEAVAARQLWAASGEKLVELARKAAGPDSSPLDHFAFRKMMATHAAIQAEVIGARTETARALASWAMPVKGGVERARLIDQVLESTGGVANSKEMATRIAMLAEAGASPASIGKFAAKGYGEATVDAIKELWVNGLLSSPKTHVANVISNTMTAFQSIYERQAAGLINAATGGGADGVQMGEALAMTYGMVGGLKDSFKLAAQYLKSGESKFNFSKVDLLKPDAISSESFRMAKDTGMGRFLDYLGKGVGTPMHLLGAEDEFFKSIGYRMEVRAQALRTAVQEGNVGEALAKRVAELIDNPSEAMRINSADAALYQTFNNQMGAFGKAVMNLRNIDHPLNPLVFVLPFVRTPANIARYAFERTPFAPLVSQWRADIAAGGARADLAMARMATGSAIMMVAMDYADRGDITGAGPGDADKGVKESLARQGWKPYSIKIGDRFYSYDRTDPFGMTVGFAASIAETVKKGELDQDDVDEWQEVTAMVIAAVSQVAISKTYLEGFSKFVEVLSDPKRYSESYINSLMGSFLPATSLNAAVKNMVDPVQRETNSPMDAIKARIAGLSEKLPPRRNLWGEPVRSDSGIGSVYDALVPVASKQIVNSPIDREMVRLEDSPGKITKKTVFNGVQANFKKYPEAYDEYVRLAGNDLKHPAWGMGAKDYLNAVVEGKHPMSAVYSIMSDESKRAFIRNAVSDYRKMAQQQVLADPKFADFAREINGLKGRKFEAQMPIMGE